ncbi:MAG TPA: protein kinase, partial [Phototrophicaceae bacterium]|nr:protein kinase [Phototrophicaceae bacterium]
MNDSIIGKRIANFQVERLLGYGGMAEVYFGRDISLQRPVAIKVINMRFRDDPAYAERFISEARAVALWRHENIVQVYYAGKQDDLYYFVMEYIDGANLATLLSQYAAEGELMPYGDVIKIGYAVAGALDYAHKKGVIHRDVKPANTMISTDDRVVLMDFGLALDVQQGSIGEIFGTPHYVSPEQARRSADATPQSDIYSLGIMLYEMLTGVLPFDDPSPTAVALQHLSMQPPPPRSLNRNLSQQAEDVLLKTLAKNPKDRYQTATEFIQALEVALSQKVEIVATAELPPLPPGMTPPNLSMSNRTVAERVALNINQTMTQLKPDLPRVPVTKKAQRSEAVKEVPVPPAPKRSWMVFGVALVAMIVLVGLGIILSSTNRNNSVGELPTLISTTKSPVVIVDNPSQTSTEISPVPTTVILPTITDTPPDATIIPATVAELPSTNTNVPPTATEVSPTNTSTSAPPTATEIPPTGTPIPPTVPPEPTVLYPNGRSVQLLWNDTSFYWFNPTGSSVRV